MNATVQHDHHGQRLAAIDMDTGNHHVTLLYAVVSIYADVENKQKLEKSI